MVTLLFLGGVALLFLNEWRLVRTEYQVSVSEHLHPYDCGVVLTGASGRLREAFEVLAQKKIKKLIISGVYKDTQLREIFPQLPFYPEISESDIILEKHSETTFGNAIQSLAVVRSLQCRNILLMTSQLHMHRAYKIFKEIYPSTVSIAPFSILNPTKELSKVDLMTEVTKSVFYTLFGRVLEVSLFSSNN